MSNLTKSTLRQGSCQDELMSHFEVRNHALFICAIEMRLSPVKEAHALTGRVLACVHTKRLFFSVKICRSLEGRGLWGQITNLAIRINQLFLRIFSERRLFLNC
jgi:hypothetical protein